MDASPWPRATDCHRCRVQCEANQVEINANFGSNFEKPMVYYRQLVSVACGRDAREAVLDGRTIKAKKLEEIAAK